MRRSAVVPSLLGVALLLAGCGNWWQRHQTQQQQQALATCLQRRQAIDAYSNRIRSEQAALISLETERYQPTPAPQPPDPDVASRFSQLDQQLDQERYESTVETWRQREQQRHQRWSQNQRDRRERIQQRLDAQLTQLGGLDPSLIERQGGRAVAVNTTALTRLRRCFAGR